MNKREDRGDFLKHVVDTRSRKTALSMSYNCIGNELFSLYDSHGKPGKSSARRFS